jgi:hypothetical protein
MTLTIEAMALTWLVLSVILIGIELHHVAFYAMFGALGAAIGAIVAYFAPSALAAQVASGPADKYNVVTLVGPDPAACGGSLCLVVHRSRFG